MTSWLTSLGCTRVKGISKFARAIAVKPRKTRIAPGAKTFSYALKAFFPEPTGGA
ncbi:MAG: hypothetical protein HGA76_10210 [Candidatus Firestonebacteria bacterium]|nr:hypothetical protein [Candidatus Firestonebacteria bacterium]